MPMQLCGQEFTSGKYHVNSENVMLQGYDPVSYFNSEKPIMGKAEFSITHDGVVYNFSSEANKTLFVESPEKYIPAYGGFCAFGLGMDPSKTNGFAQGRYKTSPLSYKVIDSKLHLFYPQNEWPALTYWNRDEEFFKKRADKKWKEIKDN